MEDEAVVDDEHLQGVQRAVELAQQRRHRLAVAVRARDALAAQRNNPRVIQSERAAGVGSATVTLSFGHGGHKTLHPWHIQS